MPRWVYGVRPVRELLRGDASRTELLVFKAGHLGGALGELLALAGEKGLKHRRAEAGELERLSKNGNHQGVAARVGDFDYAGYAAWLAALAARDPRPDVLLLDGVQDPQNLGALIRTAETFGLGGVLLPKDRSAAVTEAAGRASAGAVEYLPIVQAVNLVRAMGDLKERGYWLTGAVPDAPLSLYDADLAGPNAIVLGGEGEGLRRLVRESCDLLVSLPRLGRIESLNVSVAGGIVLAEIHRRRRAGRS